MEFFIGEKNFEHDRPAKIGVLLVNLGTPDAPTTKALRRYLRQFLSDPRVIEIWRPLWLFILNVFVLTTRPAKSAKLYQQVWSKEGSPLLVTGRAVLKRLNARFAKSYPEVFVAELGMRYGNPSIESALIKLKDASARKILILPLYAQYSSTTTGATFDAVVDTLKKWRWVPEIRTINQYHDRPSYVGALAATVREHWEKNGKGEKLLMSFHGIPKRYFLGGDPYHCQCLKTGRLLAEALGLEKEEYIVSFQSLFGKEEWIKPYTDETIKALAEGGLKRLDVICPGFTADCLETLEEIDEQNREIFLEHGGESFYYIPALNEREDFVEALFETALENLQGWLPKGKQLDLRDQIESCPRKDLLLSADQSRLSKVV